MLETMASFQRKRRPAWQRGARILIARKISIVGRSGTDERARALAGSRRQKYAKGSDDSRTRSAINLVGRSWCPPRRSILCRTQNSLPLSHL